MSRMAEMRQKTVKFMEIGKKPRTIYTGGGGGGGLPYEMDGDARRLA